jgi:hypothetical protein
VSSILTLIAFIIGVLASVYHIWLNYKIEKLKQNVIMIKSLPQKERVNVVIHQLQEKKKVLTLAVIPFFMVLFVVGAGTGVYNLRATRNDIPPSPPSSSAPSTVAPPSRSGSFVATRRSLVLKANCGAIGGNECSGTPTFVDCITLSTSGDPQHPSYLDVATANIENKSVIGSGDVWVVSADPRQVCGRADASVASGGRGSGASGVLVVQQMDWKPD